MFNHYFNPVPVVVKIVPITHVNFYVTERLVQDGENFKLLRGVGNLPMVDPELVAEAVSAVARARVGKTSPSATNFLSPSLEFQQQVAATLANIDDKFSYEAAIEKLSKQVETETKTETKTETE